MPLVKSRPRALSFVALACVSAAVVAAEEASLQDIAKALQALPEVVIYTAKEVVTLDSDEPTAEAVAVVGDRILATGSLDTLKAAAGNPPYRVDTTATARQFSNN